MFGNCNICGKKSSKNHPDLCAECLEIAKPAFDWIQGAGKKHDGSRDLLKEAIEAQQKLFKKAWPDKKVEEEKRGPKSPVKKRLN